MCAWEGEFQEFNFELSELLIYNFSQFNCVVDGNVLLFKINFKQNF